MKLPTSELLFPTSAMYDSVTVVRQCAECFHSSDLHEPPDYDHDGQGYVEGPRACTACNCRRFFE